MLMNPTIIKYIVKYDRRKFVLGCMHIKYFLLKNCINREKQFLVVRKYRFPKRKIFFFFFFSLLLLFLLFLFIRTVDNRLAYGLCWAVNFLLYLFALLISIMFYCE